MLLIQVFGVDKCLHPGNWELYNMKKDRTETNNLAKDYPEIVKELSELYNQWADRCNVKPWDEVQRIREQE